MDRPLVGVRAIIREKNEVLLGLHEKGHAGGFWGFPGGHMEGGEFFEQCAKGRRSNDNSKSASLQSDAPAKSFANPIAPSACVLRAKYFVLADWAVGTRVNATCRSIAVHELAKERVPVAGIQGEVGKHSVFD